MTDFYTLWCERNNVTHGHCPEHCEHPQPFGVVMKGETEPRLICGRCWHVNGTVTEIVPCGPGVCE